MARRADADAGRLPGGVSQAVARTADSVYGAFPAEEQGIARDIFLRLTELGEGTEGTRRRAALAELPYTLRHTTGGLFGFGGVRAAEWNADGSQILTSSRDGTAKVWDAASGNCCSHCMATVKRLR